MRGVLPILLLVAAPLVVADAPAPSAWTWCEGPDALCDHSATATASGEFAIDVSMTPAPVYRRAAAATSFVREFAQAPSDPPGANRLEAFVTVEVSVASRIEGPAAQVFGPGESYVGLSMRLTAPGCATCYGAPVEVRVIHVDRGAIGGSTTRTVHQWLVLDSWGADLPRIPYHATVTMHSEMETPALASATTDATAHVTSITFHTMRR